MRLLQTRAGLLLVLLATLSQSRITHAASFLWLNDTPGFPSQAYAVSADGKTVVGSRNSSSGTEPFYWTAANGLIGLGNLAGDGSPRRASAVNADGTVIVGASSGRPFRWTPSSGMQGLSDFTNGEAFAVSADGATVVGYTNDDAGLHAFRWSTTGGGHLLNDLAGGSVASIAFGINADATLAVGYGTGDQTRQIARWDPSGNISPIASPPDAGFASASAISADGSTIVGMLRTTETREGFRWSSQTGLLYLPYVPDGAPTMQPYAVNGDGSIIVGRGYRDEAQAFIWDAIHSTRALKDVLQSDYHLNLTDWTLTEARGISSDGSVIVGIGSGPSNPNQAWIAIIPEPAALVIFLPSLQALLRRRRRSYARRESPMQAG